MSPAQLLLDAPAAALDAAACDALAARLAATACRDALPQGTERRWVRLAGEADHDAWLIAWPRGTGLGLHDHGGSGAAVRVLEGELVERYVDGPDRAGVRRRTVGAGEVITFGPGHVHALHNDADTEAISLHVYSPPLGPMTFFEEVGASSAGAAAVSAASRRRGSR